MAENKTTYTYKTVGDCEIKADAYRPASGGELAPVLVYIHGGALIYGSRKHINRRQLELYQAAGYVVVSIDYRLAPETKLPGLISDLQDAFRWIHDSGRELFGGDVRRIGVVGHSAGGYLTLMSGFCVAPRPKALVAFYGYGDIVGDWYSKPDPFYCQQPRVSEAESGRFVEGPVISEPYAGRGKDKFYLYCRQNGLWPQEVGGQNPESNPAFFIPYCPVKNVTDEYPPTMLLHGNKDTDVPYEQSVLMAATLKERGVQHRFVTIKKGGHGFDGNMDSPLVQDTFRHVVDFLDAHLGRP